jgi:tRNA-(ms[2]io[6]A)-hydroxylase
MKHVPAPNDESGLPRGQDPLSALLACPTPLAWVSHARLHVDALLLDHANCEKKAVSTAVSLLFRYPENADLTQRLSRLAREELRHFEQVCSVIARRAIAFRRVPPTRYAAGLHRVVRAREPGRLVDLLVAGAFIEARSAERFAALAPSLDEELGGFYQALFAAEKRHCFDYLALARAWDEGSLNTRIRDFATAEAELITRPDRRFGFHSGPPARDG